MTAQIVAILIFIVMFLMIVTEVFERHIITLASGALVLLLVFGLCMRSTDAIIETLNLKSIFESSFWYGASEESTSGINWSTIIFILGMMVMVEGMGMSGFFRWMCLKIAGIVRYRVIPIFICFMLISAILSMFIDSITVILFLAAVTAEISRMLKFDPVPMIISEIFCANLGGAATMCGDPPNIIIGTSLGYSFFDFLSNTGVIAGISLIFVLAFFYFCFRKELVESEKNRGEMGILPSPKDAIENKAGFIGSCIIFIAAVVLLITHAQTKLTVSFIGMFVAIITLIFTLVVYGKSGVLHIVRHLDLKTLLFFVGLFISVGGLEQTGALELVAEFIQNISGGNIVMVIVIVLWLSAIASAFVDNIPFAATMVPVIQLMSKSGIDLDVLAWTLSMGTDVGGNATPIGASANVVGTSVAAKEGHPITWGKYCKYCVPATVIVLTISMICIFVRYI